MSLKAVLFCHLLRRHLWTLVWDAEEWQDGCGFTELVADIHALPDACRCDHCGKEAPPDVAVQLYEDFRAVYC